MSLRPIGGIFLRSDASGNMVIYDTAGTILVKIIGGLVSGTQNKGTRVNGAGPIGSTTSATYVTLGNSSQITPQVSGNVLVLFMVEASNNTAGDGGSFGIYRATGTLNPTGGAVPDGSRIQNSTMVSGTANMTQEAVIVYLDTGLTPGQAYTYEAAATIVTGGTFAWASVRVTINCFEV